MSVSDPLHTVHARSLGIPSSAVLDLAGVVPPGPRLAIVGSRAAERRCRVYAEAAVALAGRLGWSLVSGGAIGIDGAAHQAALERDLGQLVVAPLGADHPYPAVHASLFARISRHERSGVLYAQAVGTRPARGMFASRNTIVVALASAVLVAQAASRSGSVGTGLLALRRGLPVAALVGSAGCGALIGRGAHPLPAEVAALEPWLRGVDPRRASSRASSWDRPRVHAEREPWPPRFRWLADALARAGPGGLCVDALPDPCAALVDLVEAEAAGWIAETSPGTYHRTR